jgi:hypothetical protein
VLPPTVLGRWALPIGPCEAPQVDMPDLQYDKTARVFAQPTLRAIASAPVADRPSIEAAPKDCQEIASRVTGSR